MTSVNDFSGTVWVRNFAQRFWGNPQVVSLAVFLCVGFLLVYGLFNLLSPVFASLVLAYLLDGVVDKLQHRGLPRTLSVHLVFLLFVSVLGLVLFVLLPIVSDQTIQFVQRIPDMVTNLQTKILQLPDRYPELISETRIRQLMFSLQQEILSYSQILISGSAQSFAGLLAAIIYLFLVPMMVFFFMKDKRLIINWCLRFLPRDINLVQRVWQEVDAQIANYVRGKFLEVFILWGASYVSFRILDMNYAMLLAVLMGLSVVIPYVGATLVTFPVLGVAYAQWGMVSGDQVWLAFLVYSIIQALDGVVLVPLLFSEAVNLHPIAIIIAILLFGGLWGLWGVFFAIPLATLVKAVLNAWPHAESDALSVA
jgi:putative permease